MSIAELLERPYGARGGHRSDERVGRPARTRTRRCAAAAAARKSHWLSTQPPDFADTLLSSAHVREFGRSSVIIGAQEEGAGLHFLLEGNVEVAMPSVLQEMCVVHFLSPHDWFGAFSAVTEMRSIAEYRARTPCVTLAIRRAALIELLRVTPSMIFPMLELVGQSSQRLGEIVAETTGLSPIGRILSKLLSLSSHTAGSTGGNMQCLPVSQSELGRICCASRSTVSKVLKGLEKDGIISVGYGQIDIWKRDQILECLKGERA